MDSKIMQIFYGNDCLPYKDKERTIHYPVIGNSFTGANNTTQLRFYVRDIGGTTGVSWVAVSKLPNGQIGNKVLSSPAYDADVGEFYLALDLSSYYTSIKGEVYISLNGYQGGVLFEQDPDTGIYEISGTPTIQATGVVKIAINYAPQIIEGTHFEENDLQQVLGLIAEKLDITSGIFVFDSQTDLTGLSNGQLLFNIEDGSFYQLSSGSPTRYTLVYSKSDIDTLLSGKVDKTNQASKLYGTDSDGHQALIPIEDETGDVARRDSSGQLVVPLNPSYNGNATSKKYVDGFGYSISATIDTTTYVMTLKLKDKNNNVLSTQTIDLPLESVVVGGSYDDDTESIILNLNNGNTITIPVSDLVSGLVSTADLNTALALYYTKTETDTLLGGKANTSGDYPLLNVGKAELAENLTPYGENSGVSDNTPFVFQSSGGDSEISNNALFRKLIGKTYIFYNDAAISQVNGFSGTQSFNSTTGYLTLNGSFTTEGNHGLDGGSPRKAKIIEGHKYLRKIRVDGTISEELIIKFAYVGTLTYTLPAGTYTNQDIELPIVISNWTNTNEVAFGSITTTQVFTNFSIRIQLFDLTEIFGEGNEPTTVDQFNNLFPKPYYAYGVSLISAKSSSYKVIGFNAFDGEIEPNIYSQATGEPVNSTHACRGKNYIRVIPGKKYATSLNPNLYGLSSRYSSLEIYEYDYDKNFIRKQQASDSVSYDEATRTRVYQLTDNTHFIHISLWSNNSNYATNTPTQDEAKFCVYIYWDSSRLGYYENYVVHTYTLPDIELRSVGDVYDEIDYEGNYIQRIGTRTYESGDEDDSDVITDGTTTYYVLNDEITTTTTGWSLSTDIDNWGTQEFIGNGYPQGNDFFYPVDYKAFVDSLGGREDVGWDAAELVSQTELQDAIDNIDIPEIDTTELVKKILSVDSQRHLTSGEARQCVGGAQIESSNFVNIGGNLIKNPYITGIQTTTTTIDITAVGLNTSQQMLLLRARLTVNASDDSVAVSETGVVAKTLNQLATTNDFGFKVMTAPTSTTLTDEQINTIINGCVIYGTWLGNLNLVFLPYGGDNANVYWGLYFYGEGMRAYSINKTTKVISIYGDAAARWRLYSIGYVNGKQLPAYPNDSATYNFKYENNQLVWVANQTVVGTGTFASGSFTLASSLFSDGLYYFTYGNCSGFSVITSTMIANTGVAPIRIAMPVIYDGNGSARAGVLGIVKIGDNLVFSLADNNGTPVVDGYQMTIIKTGIM